MIKNLLNKKHDYFIVSLLCSLLIICSKSHAALSAQTANTIRGHEPRLSTTLEQEISQGTSIFSLFQFEFNGIIYDDSNIAALKIEPMLYSPQSLKNSIVAGLKTTLSDDDATDSDGDKDFSLSAIDSLVVKIKNSASQDITNTTSNFCYLNNTFAPYSIEISGDIRLSTQYGDPSNKDYTQNTLETNYKQPSKTFQIPGIQGVCYARPNINIDNKTSGPWVSNTGFKLQSVTDASKNFPTTGFNGAYFSLVTLGVNATELTFDSTQITQGNITASISIVNNNTINVALTGPSSGETNGLGPIKYLRPGIITIQDKDKKINYSFDIKQWFIPHAGALKYDVAESYCNTLTGSNADYRLPTRAELSNSVYANATTYPPYPATDGTNSLLGSYTRQIGEGMFAEWGYASYPNSDWERSVGIWTSEAWSSTQQYTISTGSAYVNNAVRTTTRTFACINN